MAGLLDIFGTGGLTELGLLGVNPEEINRYRDDAQAQALYKLAENMFAGGPTGASIAKGLSQGQQAYKEAMRGQMTDMLTQQKLAEAVKAKQNEQMLNKLVSSAYQPAKTTYEQLTPQQIEQAAAGQRQVGQTTTPASFDLAGVAPALMAIPGGMEKLASLADVVPKLRKAGVTGQQKTGDNPFTVIANDPTVPAVYRNLAARYGQNYNQGLIDDETADKRMKELSDAAQRAAQFQQTQAGLESQRAVANALAQTKVDERKAKLDQAAEDKASAKDQLSSTVQALKDSYDVLKKEGAITSESATPAENLQAKFATSQIGQWGASALGTKAATERQKIEQTRPLLLNLIKTATGMSAQQMNSNAEMNMYLRAATDPNLSYEANMAALKNLDKMFGLGMMKDGGKGSEGITKSGW